MHEYLTISGIEPSVWVVFASNYLDKAPLQLWEARKTQLSSQPEVLYSWDNFKEWCLSSFSVFFFFFGLQDSCPFLSSKRAFRTPDEPEVRRNNGLMCMQ